SMSYPERKHDTVMNHNTNNMVWSISGTADHKVQPGSLIHGTNSIGGQTRNRIARLDATTGLADSLDPNANNEVHKIVVQGDGKILVGGDFNGANKIGGQTRKFRARLDATTGLGETLDQIANK